MKTIRRMIPELLLLSGLILMMTGNKKPDYVMLIPATVLLIQVLAPNRIIGMGTGIICGLVAVLLWGATLSEYAEFGIASKEALSLLAMGSLLSGALLLLSLIMIRKYIRKANMPEIPSPQISAD